MALEVKVEDAGVSNRSAESVTHDDGRAGGVSAPLWGAIAPPLAFVRPYSNTGVQITSITLIERFIYKDYE